MTSSDLEEQTLRLTVKLQAEEVEGGEGDEEIGGFINSDGEVFDWDDSEFFTAGTFMNNHEITVISVGFGDRVYNIFSQVLTEAQIPWRVHNVTR